MSWGRRSSFSNSSFSIQLRNTKFVKEPRVFITPIIDDKWIFIIGGSFAVADGDSQERVNAILIELSKKLNKAYCFTSQLRMGFYSWTIAMNGEIIRQHVGEGNIIDLGFPTIPEIEIREKKKANGEEIDEEYLIDWLPDISNYFCIHPEKINNHTKFTGVGYIVKTEYGLKNGIPKRALAYWWSQDR